MNVPIYLDGDRKLLSSEWAKSLELLRDSLQGRYGPIAVTAPTLPASMAEANQALVCAPDAVNLFPGFDLRCRAREYWMQQRAGWCSQLRSLVAQAEVVHGCMDDVYRPIAFEGFRIAIQLRKPALFLQDTDIVIQQRQLAAQSGIFERAKASTYALLYERLCRWGVAHATLSLLKGSALMHRYSRFAQRAREFHDTSFSARDIVSQTLLEQRVTSLDAGRPLKLVYCGRLVERKGVDRSLQIVAAAISRGAAVEFDVIGDGPERERLQQCAASAGISQAVRFLGAAPYDSTLLSRLAEYDALLFTPTAEDTPRMIFDGYAAALPLVGFDIGYVVERHEQERATILLPKQSIEQSAMIIEALCTDRAPLRALAYRARQAAFGHSSESWYQRRADWTFEAVSQYPHVPAESIASG